MSEKKNLSLMSRFLWWSRRRLTYGTRPVLTATSETLRTTHDDTRQHTHDDTHDDTHDTHDDTHDTRTQLLIFGEKGEGLTELIAREEEVVEGVLERQHRVDVVH
jgi:hypothetical protein